MSPEYLINPSQSLVYFMYDQFDVRPTLIVINFGSEDNPRENSDFGISNVSPTEAIK